MLAIGRPIGTMPRSSAAGLEPRASRTRSVVSVGPYMLVSEPPTARELAGEIDRDSASPPTKQVLDPAQRRRDLAIEARMRAIDGVHWRCVTRCCLSARGEPMDASEHLGASEFLRLPAHPVEQRQAREHLAGGHAEVDQAGDLVDADRPQSLRSCARQRLGRAEQPARLVVAFARVARGARRAPPAAEVGEIVVGPSLGGRAARTSEGRERPRRTPSAARASSPR